MADESWYRRRTWTPDDKAAFFSRLKRSRGGFHKAQYCRIQAYELQCGGLYREALELLDQIMTEWPEEAQRAAVYSQKAECLERLGDQAAAIAAYQFTFEEQRKQPGFITAAHLGFAWLVATTPYPEYFDEGMAVLSEFGTASPMPLEEFQACVARAMILDAKGDREGSRREATTALRAAQKTHSGFAHHATLGLVQEVSPDLRRTLERLAANDG